MNSISIREPYIHSLLTYKSMSCIYDMHARVFGFVLRSIFAGSKIASKIDQ